MFVLVRNWTWLPHSDTEESTKDFSYCLYTYLYYLINCELSFNEYEYWVIHDDYAKINGNINIK